MSTGAFRCYYIKMEIRKLSNFVPCFRIISSILHPFLTLFEGYKSYKLYEITPKKRFS